MACMPADDTSPDLRPALPLWLRIGAAVLVGYLVATVVAGAFLARQIDGVVNADRRRWLDDTLELLAPAAEEAISGGDYVAFRRVSDAASAMSGLRVTLIRASGEVVAESERELPLADHTDRPEFRAALRDGHGESIRGSATVGERFLYVGRRLDAPDGRAIGVLRLAVPEAESERQSADLLTLLVLALGGGLPVVALVAWYAARRIARPLEEMTVAAMRAAEGDLDALPRGERRDEAGRLADALHRMGRELSTMLAKSESDRAELAAILASMVEGVIAVDESACFLRANQGALRLLDVAGEPSPGIPLLDVVRLPDLVTMAADALAGRLVHDKDIVVPGTSGTILDVSAAPIRSASESVMGAVLVLRDVSALRRLERARLDFVANVSHELRTPVAAVLGALETVQDLDDPRDGTDEESADDPDDGPNDADARKKLVTMAFRNATRLAAIVNDLLALSAIETEADHMERVPVSLARSIRGAAAGCTADAALHDVAVHVPEPGDGEILVNGHDGRLELVWVNLIGNAIKYTPAGGAVKVSITLDAARQMACAVITDTGVGIPEAALPRIFERFYRVDKGRSRDRGGTGLGLAIVKHIVRAHLGRIDVTSEPGVGTTFRVWLPLSPTASGD